MFRTETLRFIARTTSPSFNEIKKKKSAVWWNAGALLDNILAIETKQ